MSAAIDYTYRYPFASVLERERSGAGLSLATSSETAAHPYFFQGRMRNPHTIAEMLVVLSDVVRTHFFLPVPPLMDPVLTSNDSMLRVEGFSGCCGVYARVDLAEDAFDGELKGRGTTNVDFNDPMRAALRQVRRNDELRFSVGKEEFAIEHDGNKVVEKKVKLPIRWIKGFSEVQAYQPRLELRYELGAPEALRLIRSFPKTVVPKRPSYVVGKSGAVRLSQREQAGAVRLLGTHRVQILESLLVSAKGLRVWADPDAGTSAWEVVGDGERLTLLVSPEVYRGFSGEGQVLEMLAGGKWQGILSKVRAQMSWQNELDAQVIAARIDVTAEEVEAALAVLGARGLAGYDANSGNYFHRELPFDLGKLDELQPRLKGATRLLSDNNVKALEETGQERAFTVAGTNVEHYVRLRADGDRCTCPWFSKHGGQRGPCKHILAAQMFEDTDEPGE